MTKCVGLYIRVSTDKQSNGLEAQQRALENYCKANQLGPYVIFSDEAVSGVKALRPGLNRMMEQVRLGFLSGIVVYSFSRFARSTRRLLEALEFFQSHEVSFTSLSDKLETSSPTGRAVFTIIAAISQLERELIGERVRNGLANARTKGKRLGRPSLVNREIVKALVIQKLKYREIAKLTGASHWTIREVIKDLQRSECTVSDQTDLHGKQLIPPQKSGEDSCVVPA